MPFHLIPAISISCKLCFTTKSDLTLGVKTNQEKTNLTFLSPLRCLNITVKTIVKNKHTSAGQNWVFTFFRNWDCRHTTTLCAQFIFAMVTSEWQL